MSQLDIYQQVIIDHNRKPRNFGPMADKTHGAEGFNPLCGDHLWVYLLLDADERLEKVGFEGDGCAISKASASLMTSALKGAPRQEAQERVRQFLAMIKGELVEEDLAVLGKLKIFANIKKFPARVKCAGLAWHTLAGALEQKQQPVTTE